MLPLSAAYRSVSLSVPFLRGRNAPRQCSDGSRGVRQLGGATPLVSQDVKMASEAQAMPSRKRNASRAVNITNEEQILQWLNEEDEHEFRRRRGDFVLHLARELVLPALKQRVYNEKLPRELRMTLRRVLGRDLPPPPPPSEPESSSARKLCRVCPSKLKRQTRFVYCACTKPICLSVRANL
ncbi:hypothetical protein MSG28_014435 [Choristoneura fumiferana]|uniref:Uncharacterized protein n=1 Tax=Choristoneura fumiferana TaxID=7141 RepID=A0ACC0JRK0_CHOFU|nr:hypothetical protein MSG28_014435 [Choristoneura fumiferana]